MVDLLDHVPGLNPGFRCLAVGLDAFYQDTLGRRQIQSLGDLRRQIRYPNPQLIFTTFFRAFGGYLGFFRAFGNINRKGLFSCCF